MPDDPTTRSAADPPIACQPFALTAAERARSRDLRRALAAATREARSHGEGYAFRLRADPEVFRQAAEWITLERRCCPFLDFALRWPRAAPEPWLEVTGPAGTREFLAAEMPELPRD